MQAASYPQAAYMNPVTTFIWIGVITLLLGILLFSLALPNQPATQADQQSYDNRWWSFMILILMGIYSMIAAAVVHLSIRNQALLDTAKNPSVFSRARQSSLGQRFARKAPAVPK
jgi:hypothetical protein